MHLSNRGDAPPDRNQPWTKSVYSNQAEMGGLPPFQLRIPCHPPMQSKSQFLYTSITPRRTPQIPRPERGGALTPLGANRGHQARDIHQSPATGPEPVSA